MIIIVALSLSLLVVLAALALLAKTKKEDLPKGYVFASYATLSLGILMFLGSIMGGIMKSCQHRGNDSCYSSQHGAKCSQFSDCTKSNKCSSHKGIHNGQHKSCGSSCTKDGHHSSCSSRKDGKAHKRSCIKKEGISKEIEIKVELGDDDDESEE
jgi:hypothetical protein